MISIGNDKSFVCFVLIARIDCGRKEKVVRVAAISPITKVGFKNYFCDYEKSWGSNLVFIYYDCRKYSMNYTSLEFIYSTTLSLFILSCCIESLSLTVIVLSSIVPESTVMQNGVPHSSCLLYLLPTAPESS